MSKDYKVTPIVIIAILFIIYIVSLRYNSAEFAYYRDGRLINHFIYVFFHANIFHLLGNCLAIYFAIKSPKSFFITYIIAIITSFIAIYSLPTLGFSTIIYAALGLRLDLKKIPKYKSFYIPFFLSLFIGLVIPNINGLSHIVSFALGQLFLLIYKFYKSTSYDYKRINR